MKVMVYEGVGQIAIQEVPDLPIARDQVRIDTLFTGISHGTEMAVYRGTAPFFRRQKDVSTGLFGPAEQDQVWSYPVRSCDPGVWYMGYAHVGRVVEKGPNVRRLEIGDIVYSNAPHQTQVVKNETETVKLPPGLKPEYGVFFTNLMTAFNAILDTRIKLGDTVVVSGLGVLGQLLVQMCKMSGALCVYGVDLLEGRRLAALANGADAVFDPAQTPDVAAEIRKLTGNKGPDSVIEASGSVAALQEAIRIAAPDTTVTALGWYQGACQALNLSEEFHHNRIIVRSSQAGAIQPEIRHMWDDARKERTCLELLGRLKLDNLITGMVPYDRIADAYREIDTHSAQSIQMVLQYERISSSV